MQNRLFKKKILYIHVEYEKDWPIQYFEFTQKYAEPSQMHYHDSFEIGFCKSGSGLFFVDNKVISFKSGDVFIIFPHQPHIAQSPDEVPSEWVFVEADLQTLLPEDKNFLQLMLNKYDISNKISADADGNTSGIIKMLMHEIDCNEKHYPQVITHLLSVLIIKYLRMQGKSSEEKPMDSFTAVLPALNQISSNYSEDISVESLARLCGLSTTYFRFVFKKATGYSPLNYIAFIRMKMAKTLLKSTDISILSLANNVGYSSISSFNRAFKDMFNTTPTSYRKNNKLNG